MGSTPDDKALDLNRILAAARQLQAEGDLKGAVEIYRDVLQVAPENPDAHHLFGLAAAQAGNLEVAEQVLGRAVALSPGNASYHLDLGRIFLAANRPEPAKASFRRALALNPDSADSLVELGRACLVAGDAAEATMHFQNALRADPANRQAIAGIRDTQAFSAIPAGVEAAVPTDRKKPKLARRDIVAAIAKAIALQNSGQLEAAEDIYRSVLALEHDNPDALNLLGVIFHVRGDQVAAADLFRKALRRTAGVAMVHNNLGLALHAQGLLDEAMRSYEKAVALDPRMAEAYLNLGTAYEEAKKSTDAMTCYRRAIELQPEFAKAYQNLGKLLCTLHGDAAGTHELERAVSLAPLSVPARIDLASQYLRLDRDVEAEPHLELALALAPEVPDVQNTYGWLLQKKGQFEAAMERYERACQLRPDYADALNNLGAVLNELGRYEEAILPLQKALQLKPGHVGPYINLSVVSNNLERYDEALAYAQQGLAFAPNTAALWNSAGCVYRNLAQFDKAEQHFRHALELKPDMLDALNNQALMYRANGHPERAEAIYREALKSGRMDAIVKWNLALALISQGKLHEGWELFEYRWQAILHGDAGRFPQPWWQGEPLAGKRILLRAEQGVGDEIMFAGPIGDVVAQAAECLIEVDARLAPLFRRSFPAARVFPRGDDLAPELLDMTIDFQAPFGNLLRWLRPNYEAFPRSGFLRPDAGRAASWRARLRRHGDGPIVGISWRSRLMTHLRSAEFTRLEDWGPIFAIPGLIFVNLQYDESRAEIEEAQRRFGVTIHVVDDVDLFNDLDGAAALTAACDIVVSAPTSVSAMAGAVGVPCDRMTVTEDWLDLGAADWTPLLPSVTLVKRRTEEDWTRVIGIVAARLRQRFVAA